jgi:hypothetical protein
VVDDRLGERESVSLGGRVTGTSTVGECCGCGCECDTTEWGRRLLYRACPNKGRFDDGGMDRVVRCRTVVMVVIVGEEEEEDDDDDDHVELSGADEILCGVFTFTFTFWRRCVNCNTDDDCNDEDDCIDFNDDDDTVNADTTTPPIGLSVVVGVVVIAE